MKKPQIRNIVPYFVYRPQTDSLSCKITEFHVNIIEHRLYHLDFTTEQKVSVIDNIIENLKSSGENT